MSNVTDFTSVRMHKEIYDVVGDNRVVILFAELYVRGFDAAISENYDELEVMLNLIKYMKEEVLNE